MFKCMHNPFSPPFTEFFTTQTTKHTFPKQAPKWFMHTMKAIHTFSTISIQSPKLSSGVNRPCTCCWAGCGCFPWTRWHQGLVIPWSELQGARSSLQGPLHHARVAGRRVVCQLQTHSGQGSLVTCINSSSNFFFFFLLFHPDMTFAVDWASNVKNQSIYPFLPSFIIRCLKSKCKSHLHWTSLCDLLPPEHWRRYPVFCFM